jgi:hypothetical protein
MQQFRDSCLAEAGRRQRFPDRQVHPVQQRLFLSGRSDRRPPDLALVLVEGNRGNVADAVDSEPEARGLARDLRDLELAARRAENSGEPRRRIVDAGNVSKAAFDPVTSRS